jgi:hypothetical protein
MVDKDVVLIEGDLSIFRCSEQRKTYGMDTAMDDVPFVQVHKTFCDTDELFRRHT